MVHLAQAILTRNYESRQKDRERATTHSSGGSSDALGLPRLVITPSGLVRETEVSRQRGKYKPALIDAMSRYVSYAHRYEDAVYEYIRIKELYDTVEDGTQRKESLGGQLLDAEQAVELALEDKASPSEEGVKRMKSAGMKIITAIDPRLDKEEWRRQEALLEAGETAQWICNTHVKSHVRGKEGLSEQQILELYQRPIPKHYAIRRTDDNGIQNYLLVLHGVLMNMRHGISQSGEIDFSNEETQ